MTQQRFTIRRIDQDFTDGVLQASCFEHLLIGLNKFCQALYDADAKQIWLTPEHWHIMEDGVYFKVELKCGREKWKEELFITRCSLIEEHEYIEGVKSPKEIIKEAIESLKPLV